MFKDSASYGNPLRDSVALLDTLVVPDTVKGQVITVTPFITDSLNQRVLGTPAQYAVQSPANATTVPIVRTGVSSRLEVTDTVFVEATDPVGISVELRGLCHVDRRFLDAGAHLPDAGTDLGVPDERDGDGLCAKRQRTS